MFTMKLILKLIKFWGKIIMQVEKYGDMDIWEWKENGNNIKFEHNLGFFPDFFWGYYIRLVSLDDRKYVWVNCHLEYLSCMKNFIHNFVLTGVFRDALRRNCFFMKIKNKKHFLPKYFTTKQRKCTFKTISLTHISFINLLERYERHCGQPCWSQGKQHCTFLWCVRYFIESVLGLHGLVFGNWGGASRVASVRSAGSILHVWWRQSLLGPRMDLLLVKLSQLQIMVMPLW